MVMEFPAWGDFYKGLKNDPDKAQQESFELGTRVGHALMARLDLKGADLDTLVLVLNAFAREVRSEPTAKVEGNKVVITNKSFCPIMVSARAFNIPWHWLDENAGWPFFKGLASAVNPNVEHKVAKARAKGDLLCEHIFEIS